MAAGDVVAGTIGPDVSRNSRVRVHTLIPASRLEGANKSYGTRILISETTALMAEGAIEAREIDSIVVVGKSEPQRVFEALGRRGELDPATAQLRDRFAAGLAA